MEILGEEGIVAQQKACNRSTPADRLLDRYGLYLRDERAVCPGTAVTHTRVARGFLEHRFGGGRPNLSERRTTYVLRFVQHQVARGSRKTAQLACSALRSFLQYARYRGEITTDLAAGVPEVANWSMPSIPRSIAPDDLRRVLAHCNRRSAVNSRDYAILLLLARLGLRAGAIRCNPLAGAGKGGHAGACSRAPTSSPLRASPHDPIEGMHLHQD